MRLLKAHEDETQARFRLLGPKRHVPEAAAEPAAQGEVSGRPDGLQAEASSAGGGSDTAWKEPPR